MLVPVIYFDGYPGKVKSDELDEMIRKRAIIAFRRSGEWVRVGIGGCQHRGSGGKYSGPDRRGR
jgi:hypothetical protein